MQVFLQNPVRFRRKNPVEIVLPVSKSISNRLLILQAMSGKSVDMLPISTAHDSILMKRLLQNYTQTTVLDVEDAGTVARFLTAFLASRRGKWTLTGSKRMHRRPVAPLVSALRQMGAHIQYIEQEGFLPLAIEGRELKGGDIKIDASVSSQFISALLMIAPFLKQRLHLHFTSAPVSFPYVEMTIRLLRSMGVEVQYNTKEILIHPASRLNDIKHSIESDWSATAFWYAFIAIAEEKDISIRFRKLHDNSLQGDRMVADYFAPLGVKTVFFDDYVEISKGKIRKEELAFDLLHTPDLAQAMIVTIASLGMKAKLTGLQSLRLKETDRIKALEQELQKFNVSVIAGQQGELQVDGTDFQAVAEKIIEIYDDHRMAMAFTPLTLKTGNLRIDNPGVVRKSYPGFWEETAKFLEVQFIPPAQKDAGE